MFLDRPEIASGEALAGVVRPGNAGSNTAADHIEVLRLAVENLPEAARPSQDNPEAPRYVVRGDSAGATHDFARECFETGVGFSFGFAITEEVRRAIGKLSKRAWRRAIEDDGEPRDGAWVAEITAHLDLSAWPRDRRVIVRKERPHPGAQLSLFDTEDGLRHTAFICCPPHRRPRPALARRTGASSPPTRPRRGPHPPGQSRRASQPALQGSGREPSLAGMRAGLR